MSTQCSTPCWQNALCVMCEEREGDTTWYRSGMCDVGSPLYKRAGLPEGLQWDGCHPYAASLLGDDHHSALLLPRPLNRCCKHAYIHTLHGHIDAHV